MCAFVLEACVDSVDGALAAHSGGADRIELCAGLIEGGTTPSAAAIELARRHLAIRLHVMIRPRGGDFCYSELELAVMQRDIAIAKQLGADGVVLGVLRPDATVDVPATAALVRQARPLAVTFHRAFDMTADPFAALETLIGLGVERVLTSGQEATAHQGSDLIAALVSRAAGRIVVMAGSGINEDNVTELVQATGVQEVHLSGRAPVASAMRVRNPRISLGGSPRLSDYERLSTSTEHIRACRDRLNQIAQSA